MFSFLQSKKSITDSGLLRGAVDNHSHILPGVDDGVRSMDESLAILSYLEELGLSTLWLTPHTMEDVPNTTEGLKARFQKLKDSYHGPIRLNLASEYMMDTNFASHLAAKDLLTHEGNRVLVETSTWCPPIDFWDLINTMLVSGYTPILAHPERYRYMKESDYARLRSLGVLFQLNLPSLSGQYGSEVAAKAFSFLDKGWYCMAGSDCHRLHAMQEVYRKNVLGKSAIQKLEPILQGGCQI